MGTSPTVSQLLVSQGWQINPAAVENHSERPRLAQAGSSPGLLAGQRCSSRRESKGSVMQCPTLQPQGHA